MWKFAVQFKEFTWKMDLITQHFSALKCTDKYQTLMVIDSLLGPPGLLLLYTNIYHQLLSFCGATEAVNSYTMHGEVGIVLQLIISYNRYFKI